jgi:bifunctional UDP-N-acetylglucosamine pyrophosphorylase / glucosamine-1-phosphate N-acetyltransferase
VPVGGAPMGLRVVHAARTAGIDQFVFVLRYRAQAHAATFGPLGALLRHPGASEGTAHSAALALTALNGQRAPVLLCFSDLPHLPAAAFTRIQAVLAATQAPFVLSIFDVGDGDDVGRVARDDHGRAVAIGQPRLGATLTAEGDGGLYAMRRDPTLAALGAVRNDNARREFGLPDVVEVLDGQGLGVATAPGSRDDFVSVNTPAQLSRVRLKALSEDRRGPFAARYGLSIAQYLEVADTQVGALLDAEDPWTEAS